MGRGVCTLPTALVQCPFRLGQAWFCRVARRWPRPNSRLLPGCLHPLVRNYDWKRAKFETYVYASFVRFARPRIIRLHRWNDALVQPSGLTMLDTAEVRVEPPETAQRDIKAVSAAAAKLVPFERELLIAYVSSPATSERDLARRYSLTRYRLRMLLADALAKTAVHLGETSALDDAERSDHPCAVA